MSIQAVSAYRVGEQVFPTIQEAQKKEIMDLGCTTESADLIIAHTDEVVAILTCQPRTKKVRSDKGTKRKPKTPPAVS
jgi:hypothetical protein